ncbi:MAG: hypothetical protein GXY85_04370 [Candidatus Brocadiaceae bacterium]|nr:hypothetical protein [Candidatus Brocadiaceae bacterium]
MAVSRASDGEKALKAFGWQAVALNVPPDWELAYTRGSRETGRVRLTDGESVRLELDWRTDRGVASPAAVAGLFLAKQARKARRNGTAFDVQRGLNLAHPPGMDVECYRCVGPRQVLAMVSRCRECRRLVHLQILGARDDSLRSLARRVFSSLRDHPDEGVCRWSIFDVRLQTPERLRLAESSLQSGRIRLSFARGPSRLEFTRVSLADVLLARQSLADWFRTMHARRLRRRRFVVEEAPVRGHAGLRVHGRRRLLLDPGRPVGRGRVLRAACWHCEETNRLFLCAFDGLARDLAWFEPAVEAFECCDGGEATR